MCPPCKLIGELIVEHERLWEELDPWTRGERDREYAIEGRGA